MKGLVTHGGKTITDRRMLDLIPLPETTESYTPVGHFALVETLAKIGRDILTGYDFVGEEYTLAQEGQQMFGVHHYERHGDEFGLTVGARNSLNKTMSCGIAAGMRVFICSNLAFKSDGLAILKKHTANVWKSLEDAIIAALYRYQNNFQQLQEDAHHMKERKLTDDQAFSLLGVLFGNKCLSPRQLSVALSEWEKPSHEEFQSRDAFSLYQNCTEALKSSSPLTRLDRHTGLHDTFTLKLSEGIWQ